MRRRLPLVVRSETPAIRSSAGSRNADGEERQRRDRAVERDGERDRADQPERP